MKAIIYKQEKSSNQSGKAKSHKWILSFIHDGSRNIDPIMGWTSSADMMQEVILKFDSLEAAKRFAEKHEMIYELIEPKNRKLTIQSYAANFK